MVCTRKVVSKERASDEPERAQLSVRVPLVCKRYLIPKEENNGNRIYY
jgi:hypothetical protein